MVAAEPVVVLHDDGAVVPRGLAEDFVVTPGTGHAVAVHGLEVADDGGAGR